MPEHAENSFEDLIGELEKEKAKRTKRMRRNVRRVKWSFLPVVLGVLSLPFWDREMYLTAWFQFAFLALCGLPIFVSIAGNLPSLLSNRERELLAEMGRLEDKRILPLILSDLMSSGITLPLPSLVRLLESVEASDAELLHANQWEILILVKRDYYLEGTSTYEEMLKLKYAALHALKQVGGQMILSEMERLRVRLAQSRENPPLLESVEECLVFVRQRAAEATSSQVLLRASSLQTQQGDILLRAADAAHHETQSDQLLRGSSKSSSPELEAIE